MTLSSLDKAWYVNKITTYPNNNGIIKVDTSNQLITYSTEIKTDESNIRNFSPEEFVHALAIIILNQTYKYPIDRFYHEAHFHHGRKGSLGDEVDLLISDSDNLPYAMWEFKSADEYSLDNYDDIKHQLFGTAPLVGAPKFLVYATIQPSVEKPTISLKCIDYSKYKTFENWALDGSPYLTQFPIEYRDPSFVPVTNGGERKLRSDCTQAEFRTVAQIIHNEFFSEHADNALYVNLVKCFLAKIFDERTCKVGDTYRFQVLYKNGKEETAQEVFSRINSELYSQSYLRYIDTKAIEPDEINSKEFAPERVKTVVKLLQEMSITQGAAINGDIIGAFFEEILRVGFKQDRGMYFTHDNLVNFMLEAVDIRGLIRDIWRKASHPDNRLPYVIDPACGSGTFLLSAMNIISSTLQQEKSTLVNDLESEKFYSAKVADRNMWAESFIYGLDPKFEMAITTKVNMVLHGDGSAHIFKQDGLQSLGAYRDSRFRPAGDLNRSIPKSQYQPDLCENFDLVISNPPFGITLSSETLMQVNRNFLLGDSSSSEALFLERSFQLLRPNGRLALVLPESIFNTSDAKKIRLFLYKFFKIKSIVSLPRNIFVDTPTLTSLLFAQKKTPFEINQWDTSWENYNELARNLVKQLKNYLKSEYVKNLTCDELQIEVIRRLKPIINSKDWFSKGGKKPQIMKIDLPKGISINTAIEHYKAIIALSSFEDYLTNWVFSMVSNDLDYEYHVFMVDEVGYKLSKRKERIRQNQLCKFVGDVTHEEVPNLHLSTESVSVEVNFDNPTTILDFMRKGINWD